MLEKETLKLDTFQKKEKLFLNSHSIEIAKSRLLILEIKYPFEVFYRQLQKKGKLYT